MTVRPLVPLVLSLLLVASSAREADASWFTIKKKKQELYRLQTRLKDERERLALANRKESEVARQLKETQRSLHQTRDHLYQLAGHLRFTEGEIRSARARLSRLKSEQNAKDVQLSQRLYATYRTGEVNILELLLGAEGLTDFLNRLHFMGAIIEADLTLLREVREKHEAVQAQARLLDTKYQEILRTKRRMNEQQRTETSIEQEREQVLGRVRTERRSLAHQVVELEEISEKLEKELSELIRREQARRRAEAGTTIFSGSFGWPVASTQTTSPFGWRRHPILGTLRFHTGVDIAAGHGAPIAAAGDGHVIYAGWYGGYGNAVVIDHGGGLSTLYAHCSALYVSVGHDVKKGQTIGAVGSTGLANGPHLHFEVRHNGTAVDPMSKF